MLKKKIIISLLTAFLLIFSSYPWAEARRPGSTNRSHKYLYRTGTPGNYRYVYPESGPGGMLSYKGQNKRSASARCQFLAKEGYSNCRAPKGYEVDHRVPLCAGGADRPSNMQLLSKEVHKAKTRGDIKACRRGGLSYSQ